MGRGRAKAKQTKVARDLKYRTYDTDFSSLERELRANHSDDLPEDDLPEEEDDDYAEYAERYGEDDDAEEDSDDDPGDALGRRYG